MKRNAETVTVNCVCCLDYRLLIRKSHDLTFANVRFKVVILTPLGEFVDRLLKLVFVLDSQEKQWSTDCTLAE